MPGSASELVVPLVIAFVSGPVEALPFVPPLVLLVVAFEKRLKTLCTFMSLLWCSAFSPAAERRELLPAEGTALLLGMDEGPLGWWPGANWAAPVPAGG